MTVHYLADGDAGAAQSIDDMRGIVDKALKSPQVYALARRIVQHVQAYDESGELRALYDWVLRNIRFVKGVIGKQSLQTVDATLALQAGQCTDLASLVAALAMSIGYPARFVAVATDPQAPDQFSHIYPEVQLEGEWIPMDAARENATFGVPPARRYRSEAFPILDAVGNMPRLGQSTADDIANAIAAAGQSAAQIIQAQQTPYVLSASGQWVANPNYAGAGGVQPVLQNTSQALGIPSLLLLGLGAWFVYTVLKR
jgi:hypothetical protein